MKKIQKPPPIHQEELPLYSLLKEASSAHFLLYFTTFGVRNKQTFFPMLLQKKIRYSDPEIILLILFKFLFSLVFTMMKIQKDSNVSLGIGAEKIAHTKIIVFFLALTVAVAYTSSTSYIRQEKLFYGIFILFIVLFAGGALLLNYREVLLPDTALLKGHWKGYTWVEPWIVLYGSWPKVLFFSIAEIYGQLVIIILFWGIANELFSRKDSKKIYPIFIAAGCLGSICGSFILPQICYAVEDNYVDVPANKGVILAKISACVLLLGTILMFLALLGYRWLLQQPALKAKIATKKIAPKERLSFLQSCKYILCNPYLRAITLLIISCGACKSLVDITYKKCVEKTSHDIPHLFAEWMRREFLFFNIIIIISCFSVTGYVMRKLSWKKVSYISPFIVMCLGIIFFGISIYVHQEGFGNATYFGLSGNKFIATFGRGQTILVTGVTYMLFDITKEMAFISLGQKARRKGKGAVDVVGSRFGKGFASTVHWAVLGLWHTTNVFDVTPILLGIFICCCLTWFYSIHTLSRRIGKSKNEEEQKEDQAPRRRYRTSPTKAITSCSLAKVST